MDVCLPIYSIIFVMLIFSGCAVAEGSSGSPTAGASNQTSVSTSGPEALMNLALDAKAYALQNGKATALSAFSDQATFVRNGMYISAYNQSGRLLADPFRADKIGTTFITGDHDAGIVRQLRDLAQSGGGILTPDMNSTGGVSYYAESIDGGWWITATSGVSGSP